MDQLTGITVLLIWIGNRSDPHGRQRSYQKWLPLAWDLALILEPITVSSLSKSPTGIGGSPWATPVRALLPEGRNIWIINCNILILVVSSKGLKSLHRCGDSFYLAPVQYEPAWDPQGSGNPRWGGGHGRWTCSQTDTKCGAGRTHWWFHHRHWYGDLGTLPYQTSLGERSPASCRSFALQQAQIGHALKTKCQWPVELEGSPTTYSNNVKLKATLLPYFGAASYRCNFSSYVYLVRLF